jgi:hypothetical protein
LRAPCWRSSTFGIPFVDKAGNPTSSSQDDRFHQLADRLAQARGALDAPTYARFTDLMTRAKLLFDADPNDMTGEADEGRTLLFQFQKEIDALRHPGRIEPQYRYVPPIPLSERYPQCAQSSDWPPLRNVRSSLENPEPYIPKALGELADFVGVMVYHAPDFIDDTGRFPEQNLDHEFKVLLSGFCINPPKLGKVRYKKLVDMAVRAKTLFLADPEDKTGQTAQGRELLSRAEELIDLVRRERIKVKLKDEDGELTGD